MMDRARFFDWDAIGVVAGALWLALALMRFLESPTRPFMRATVLGSPLGINLSSTNLMYLIILGVALTGVAGLVAHHPAARGESIPYRLMFAIVPGLLSVGLAVWLVQLRLVWAWTTVLLTAAVLLPLALRLEYDDIPRTQSAPLAAWARPGLVYLAAVLLFTIIYAARTRTLLSGTAVLLIAAVLAARLFWAATRDLPRSWLYGGSVGLILGQVTWIFNYWPLSGVQGGLSLLLIFYLLVGVWLQYLEKQSDDGRWRRRILLEYGGVTIVILLFILFASP